MEALLVIDMQMIMQQRIDAGRDTVNADAATQIRTLADAFRRAGRPVIHIRHQEADPSSVLHYSGPGYPPMPKTDAREEEAVFIKRTSSAFASTGLEVHLRNAGITDPFTTGAVAGFCVNSTVRAGADLGFRMTVVRDATIGFDLPEAGLSAQMIFDVTVAHLEADFATIADTAGTLHTLKALVVAADGEDVRP